jgi:hypothetical protein
VVGHQATAMKNQRWSEEEVEKMRTFVIGMVEEVLRVVIQALLQLEIVPEVLVVPVIQVVLLQVQLALNHPQPSLLMLMTIVLVQQEVADPAIAKIKVQVATARVEGGNEKTNNIVIGFGRYFFCSDC